MNGRRVVMALLFAALVGCGFMGPHATVLTIAVVDAQSGQAIEGAMVEVVTMNDDRPFRDTTDARGRVVFLAHIGYPYFSVFVTRDGFRPWLETFAPQESDGTIQVWLTRIGTSGGRGMAHTHKLTAVSAIFFTVNCCG